MFTFFNTIPLFISYCPCKTLGAKIQNLFAAHHHRCGNVLTPIHRYSPGSNNSGSSAGPSSYSAGRSSRMSAQTDNRHNSSHVQAQMTDNGNNLGNTSLPQSAIPGSGGFINLSDFSDAELTGYKLKCGLWFIFILSTSLVAAAKFYFDHQGGLEALALSGFLLILLISGCFYSIFCRSICDQPQTPNPITTVPTESISRHVHVAMQNNQQNPPPPYHLAILIPPPPSQDEAPPPAYDKINQ